MRICGEGVLAAGVLTGAQSAFSATYLGGIGAVKVAFDMLFAANISGITCYQSSWKMDEKDTSPTKAILPYMMNAISVITSIKFLRDPEDFVSTFAQIDKVFMGLNTVVLTDILTKATLNTEIGTEVVHAVDTMGRDIVQYISGSSPDSDL